MPRRWNPGWTYNVASSNPGEAPGTGARGASISSTNPSTCSPSTATSVHLPLAGDRRCSNATIECSVNASRARSAGTRPRCSSALLRRGHPVIGGYLPQRTGPVRRGAVMVRVPIGRMPPGPRTGPMQHARCTGYGLLLPLRRGIVLTTQATDERGDIEPATTRQSPETTEIGIETVAVGNDAQRTCAHVRTPETRTPP